MGEMSAQGLPEGMQEAVFAMAHESERAKPLIRDPKAVELAKALQAAGIGEGEGAVLGKGALARAVLLDEMVRKYVKEHPAARVVNLACGMDTRFYRVDNGSIRWYEVDLPKAMEARKRFLQEEERLFMIGESVLEDAWAEKVEKDGPVLILAERLSMYLDRQKIQKLFKIIRTHFKEAEIFMEIASPYTVKNSYENVDGQSRPRYTWGIENGRKLQQLTTGFRALRDVSLMEGLKRLQPSYYVLRYFPPLRKISNKIVILRRESEVNGACVRKGA